MIIECPECGEKNSTIEPPQPGKNYRCGKCGSAITILQTVDATTQTTESSATSGIADITGEINVVTKINRSKEYTISGVLIVLSFVIGYVNYFNIEQNLVPHLPTPFFRLWAV
ncbi:hypothetical protein ACFLV4_06790, partial [Chloroflexota bacterium]